MVISKHQRISHMPYSCHFLELEEIITIIVCFYLYNLTRYSLIDPWKWKIIFFNFCYFFETVSQTISDCTFEIIFAAVNRVYHKQRTHVSVVWRHCKHCCSLPFRKMKTCQVCSRWKIKHPPNETLARWAWCLIRVRHFLKQFEIAKGRKRQRINAETWVNLAIFPTEVHLPGGTPLFRLYGYVPLDRVWCFRRRCTKKVIQFGLPLSLTGLKPVLNRVWYYEPRDLHTDCKRLLSFLRLRLGLCEKLKELAI